MGQATTSTQFLTSHQVLFARKPQSLPGKGVLPFVVLTMATLPKAFDNSTVDLKQMTFVLNSSAQAFERMSEIGDQLDAGPPPSVTFPLLNVVPMEPCSLKRHTSGVLLMNSKH